MYYHKVITAFSKIYGELLLCQIRKWVLKWVITEKLYNYLLVSNFVVYMDKNQVAYVHKNKVGASQIWCLGELALFDFAINYWMDKSNKATNAPSHHPLNLDLPLENDTYSDKANVISYPLMCDGTNYDNVETTSYSLACEIVTWHLGTTKIPNI